MKYRAKILLTALSISFAAVGTHAVAQEVQGPKVDWRFSTWGNPRAFTAGIEYVAEQVKQKTGGNFTITVGYGEQFSKDRENLDSIKLGAIDGTHFCNFYHPGKNPAYMVFSLPFLPIDTWEANVAVREKLGNHPALVKDMDQWGGFYFGDTLLPQYEFMGRGKPPTKMSDWKGKRVRAGGGLGDAMEKLGAVKTTTTATEVYTAMQRGTMDAASFPYTYSHAAYKIPEVAQWFTSNMSPGTASCPIIFSKASWAKLPPQYQKMLQDLKPKMYEVQVDAYKKIDAKNLPEFRAKLTEVIFLPEQLEAFRADLAKPVWDEWIKANRSRFNGQELIDLVISTAAQANKK
jgi:TRAP-type C4-dicarboxylate transport system substrate-binding protein